MSGATPSAAARVVSPAPVRAQPESFLLTTSALTNLSSAGPARITIDNDDLHPVPSLASLDPDTALRASPGSVTPLRITLRGQGFVPGSEVLVDDTAVSASFVSASELTASIPAFGLSLGTHRVAVRNPAPGGGLSSPRALVYRDPSTLIVGKSPTLTPLRPVSATTTTAPAPASPTATTTMKASSPSALTLRAGESAMVTVTGSGLAGVTAIEVRLGGSSATTVAAKILSATDAKLVVQIAAAKLAAGGTYQAVAMDGRRVIGAVPVALTVR